MVFVVDGHNLIGQMTDVSLSDPDDEERLVDRLKRYYARTGRSIVVFFDPGGAFHLAKRYSAGAVEVVWAGTGMTADQLIKQRIRADKNPREITVVTSDRGIQEYALQSGSHVMEAAHFLEEMARGRQQTRRRRSPTRIPSPLAPNEVRDWLRLFGQEENGENPTQS